MNTLETKLQKDLVTCMKEGQTTFVNAIRSVKTAIQKERTNGIYHELTDNDILMLIKREVKTRRESAVMYSDAKRVDLAAVELAEANFLEQSYLPKMVSKEELEVAAKEFVQTVGPNMGAIMKALKDKYPNQVDGKLASEVVRSILQK